MDLGFKTHMQTDTNVVSGGPAPHRGPGDKGAAWQGLVGQGTVGWLQLETGGRRKSGRRLQRVSAAGNTGRADNRGPETEGRLKHVAN